MEGRLLQSSKGDRGNLALVEVGTRKRKLVLHVERVALLHLSNARLDEAASKVPTQKILQVGRMNAPIVTLAVLAALALAKALVQREIVTHTVAPSGGRGAKEGIKPLDPVVNILQA